MNACINGRRADYTALAVPWRPVGKRTCTRATGTAKAPAEHHNLTQRCLALPCPVLGVSTRTDLGVGIVVGSIDDAEHAEDANRRSLLRRRLGNKRAGGAGQLRGLCARRARTRRGVHVHLLRHDTARLWRRHEGACFCLLIDHIFFFFFSLTRQQLPFVCASRHND